MQSKNKMWTKQFIAILIVDLLVFSLFITIDTVFFSNTPSEKHIIEYGDTINILTMNNTKYYCVMRGNDFLFASTNCSRTSDWIFSNGGWEEMAVGELLKMKDW